MEMKIKITAEKKNSINGGKIVMFTVDTDGQISDRCFVEDAEKSRLREVVSGSFEKLPYNNATRRVVMAMDREEDILKFVEKIKINYTLIALNEWNGKEEFNFEIK